jgi:hypothetical protein
MVASRTVQDLHSSITRMHQEIAAFRGADEAPDYRLPFLQILFGQACDVVAGIAERRQRPATGEGRSGPRRGGATALRGVHEPADESSSLTASVSIAAWPALCGHNNAGEFEGSVPKAAPPSDHTPLGGVVRPPTNFPHLIKLREGVSWFILFS